MKAGFLGASAVLTAMALAFLACGDDDASPGGGSSSGGTSSGGTSSGGTSSGGTSSGGTSSGGTSGGNPPPPEPTCSASPTATPTWTIKDKPIAGWDGKRDDALHSRIVGIAGLAYGNGTWVALALSKGGAGADAGKSDVTWAISTDQAATWTVKTMAPAEGTQHATIGGGTAGGALLFDGKRFLFFGTTEKGTFLYTSPDGQSFTGVKVSDQALPIGHTASNGDSTIVSAGSNGNIWVTTDLETFKKSTVSEPAAGYNDITFGNGKFVVSTEPLGTKPMMSGDGVNFTGISTSLGQNISFGDGAFHSPKNPKFYTSTDAATWTEETRSGTGIGVFDGGKMYYLAGRWLLQQGGAKMVGTFATSADAKVWSEYGVSDGLATNPNHGGAPLGIAYGGCHYISFGNYWNDDIQAPFMIVAEVSPAK